jgi:hypothetical protein
MRTRNVNLTDELDRFVLAKDASRKTEYCRPRRRALSGLISLWKRTEPAYPALKLSRYFSGSLQGRRLRPRKMCLVSPVASLRPPSASSIS